MKNSYTKEEIIEIFKDLGNMIDPEDYYPLPSDSKGFDRMIKDIKEDKKRQAKAAIEWKKRYAEIQKEAAASKARMTDCKVDSNISYPPCELFTPPMQ